MSGNVSEWTPNQLRFVAWLATPSEFRKPQDHAELASEMGVAERTLYRWKKLPGLTDAAGNLARELVKDELADIYGALTKNAKKGSLGHIKLALEAAGHIASSAGTGSGVNVQVNVDNRREDREQRFERLFSELDAHRARVGLDGRNGRCGEGVPVDSSSTNNSPA